MKKCKHKWQYFKPYEVEWPAKIEWLVDRFCIKCFKAEIIEIKEPEKKFKR